jgi:hypothetical protein
LPRAEVRRGLARELGITHPELLALAGELDPTELMLPARPESPEARELADIAQQLSPPTRAALLAIARELRQVQARGRRGGLQ